jgi:large repetitive protein
VQVPVSAEGETTIDFYATDKEGNTEQEQTTTVKIDKTAPSITASRSPAANANGWNNENVTVSFTCSDELSGLDSSGCQADVVVSDEGANQSLTGNVTDKAGNTASATENDINIDKTDPTITGSRSPDANSFGWNNSDVTVSFTCSDELSGLDSSGCPDNVTLSSEGANQSVTRSVTDAAGNTASDTVHNIKIDTSAPTISDLGPTTQPNANGWYNTDVTNRFEASDSGSGLDDACQTAFSDQAGHNVQSKTTSGEGMAVKVTSDSCTDVAGNTATGEDSATFKIDKTAPSVSETIPKANATKVSRTTPVTAKFSEAVQADTLTSDTVQLFSGNSTKPVKATLSKTSNSVTLTPSTKLDANNRYTAKIEGGATGVKDLADNPLSDFSWTFTTGGR